MQLQILYHYYILKRKQGPEMIVTMLEDDIRLAVYRLRWIFERDDERCGCEKKMEIWAQQSIWRFMYSTAFVEYQDSIVKSCSLSDFLYSIKSVKDLIENLKIII